MPQMPDRWQFDQHLRNGIHCSDALDAMNPNPKHFQERHVEN